MNYDPIWKPNELTNMDYAKYEYIGKCSKCNSVFYFATGGYKACKWGRCNGTIYAKKVQGNKQEKTNDR